MIERHSSGQWDGADAYDRYMGRWSRRLAPLFIEWLDAPEGARWLDVGCGTGELGQHIAERCAPRRLVGIDPSAAFVAVAASRVPQAEVRLGDAMDIDAPDGAFDLAVGGLVLNFVQDKAKALAEMARVVRPGGHVALYVWDYAAHMQMIRQFFDAARDVDPGAVAYDEGQSPICRPRPLADAVEAAGLGDVGTTALDITTPFVDFDDYWRPFLGAVGVAPKYLSSLAEDVRARIRETVRGRLPTGPDGEILLAARAWAVRGRVPG